MGIRLPNLLDLADDIHVHRSENTIVLDDIPYTLCRSIQDHFGRLVRVAWVKADVHKHRVLTLTDEFDKFITAWDSGPDLVTMNSLLRYYKQYDKFLDALARHECIRIPTNENSAELFKATYGVTKSSMKTFKEWAIMLGHAYQAGVSKNDKKSHIFWAGDWDKHMPTLPTFRACCVEQLRLSPKSGNYANLGRLAYRVCQTMRISFQAFEKKLTELLDAGDSTFYFGRATIRRYAEDFRYARLRPRKSILAERLHKEMLGTPEVANRWTDIRYVEDGFYINGAQIKLIKLNRRENV